MELGEVLDGLEEVLDGVEEVFDGVDVAPSKDVIPPTLCTTPLRGPPPPGEVPGGTLGDGDEPDGGGEAGGDVEPDNGEEIEDPDPLPLEDGEGTGEPGEVDELLYPVEIASLAGVKLMA